MEEKRRRRRRERDVSPVACERSEAGASRFARDRPAGGEGPVSGGMGEKGDDGEGVVLNARIDVGGGDMELADWVLRIGLRVAASEHGRRSTFAHMVASPSSFVLLHQPRQRRGEPTTNYSRRRWTARCLLLWRGCGVCGFTSKSAASGGWNLAVTADGRSVPFPSLVLVSPSADGPHQRTQAERGEKQGS
ncbi:hypothetical protein BHM03_00031525 [Ensete ventricosum]|nr:hypothetical protein BHM03_00031525 [Ensete ventricosum]